MNTFPRCHFALVSLLLLGAPQAAWAQAEDATATPAGVLWEITSQPTMNMEGMTMPLAPQTSNVCAPANPVEPPGSSNDEQSCAGSSFVQDGLKVTWTAECAGPPAMTGQGEITYETEAMEAYTGVMTLATEGGTMVITLDGKRIGTCDNPMSH